MKRVSLAFTALLALSGCQALGLSPKPLKTDFYRILRDSPNFDPAWQQTKAQPFILEAMEAINTLQLERDLSP
jgi:hypothetical protein